MADDEEVVDAEEPEAETPEPETPAAPERDWEDDATKQGWVPKEQFFGDPDTWRSAEEFVKRGEEVLPMVKATMGKEINTLKSRLEEQQQDFDRRIAKQEKMGQIALQRQEQQIKAYYTQRKRAAVENMDTDAYDAAEQGEVQAMDAMHKQFAEAEKEPESKGPNLAPADQAAVTEWMAENTWFNTDRVLNAAADEAFEIVNRDMPAASMRDRLAEVKRRVSEDFPKKFGIKPNGRGASRVEGGSRQAGGGTSGKAFSTLPAEAKSSFKEFVSRGVYKDTDADRASYAKDYEDA